MKLPTPEEYQEDVTSLIDSLENEPALLRAWLEVYHSNILGKLGYDQSAYTAASLRFGWSFPHDM